MNKKGIQGSARTPCLYKNEVAPLRVNVQIFFCVGMFIQGLFIISIVK